MISSGTRGYSYDANPIAWKSSEPLITISIQRNARSACVSFMESWWERRKHSDYKSRVPSKLSGKRKTKPEANIAWFRLPSCLPWHSQWARHFLLLYYREANAFIMEKGTEIRYNRKRIATRVVDATGKVLKTTKTIRTQPLRPVSQANDIHGNCYK